MMIFNMEICMWLDLWVRKRYFAKPCGNRCWGDLSIYLHGTLKKNSEHRIITIKNVGRSTLADIKYISNIFW